MHTARHFNVCQRDQGRHPAGTAAAVMAAACLAAGLLVGCSGAGDTQDVYPSLTEKDRMTVLAAQQKQRSMGTQIESIVHKDNALDFCHEMCRRGTDSCDLSKELCVYSAKYETAVALLATCRYSREQCRRHRKRVPRQCNCDWDDD